MPALAARTPAAAPAPANARRPGRAPGTPAAAGGLQDRDRRVILDRRRDARATEVCGLSLREWNTHTCDCHGCDERDDQLAHLVPPVVAGESCDACKNDRDSHAPQGMRQDVGI